MSKPSVDALMREALARHRGGALQDASRGYAQVLAREPGHCEALHLSGVLAHQQGRNQEAVELIRQAIAGNSRAPALHNNLGMALAALERFGEAETAYREALALAPEFADALINLGNLLATRGAMREAAELLDQAVAADADSPQAHFNLGCARFALGDARGALEALERAVALGADFADAHYRIGCARAALSDRSGAVAAFALALARADDHVGAQHALMECLDGLSGEVDPVLLEAMLGPLLRGRSINPRTLGHAGARLLESKLRQNGLAEDPVAAGEALLRDPLARLYLQRTLNVSAPVERVLTRCRARWLSGPQGPEMLAPSRHEAVAAVAVQCFLNEYVWSRTPDEMRAVAALEHRIAAACEVAPSPGAALVSELLVYACYRPLWLLACAPRLRAVPPDAWPTALAELLRIGLHEPLWEQDAKPRIASGAALRNRVSRAVQAQYEEHPYPRWIALTRTGVQGIEEWVRRWNPDYAPPPTLGGALRMLVAGCGTGMDAIDTALHLRGVEITAIDLSRASLAYAMRKSAEYGVENIRFRQEDILQLGGDGEPYHVIHCTGVLHHMQDPAAGLSQLVGVLIPGGLMRLALYSRLARAPLLEARERIRTSGFSATPDGVRGFRRQVLDEGASGSFAELMGSTDFYSVSECRDLLFHVQECQLTLGDVERLLRACGLEFLGFEITIPAVRDGFRREHACAALTDLRAWAAYEERHPESFRGMYQFWCRKIGD